MKKKVLELDDNWCLIYEGRPLGWCPTCRIHEIENIEIKVPDKWKSCECNPPEEIWAKVEFLDKLDKL